MNCRTASCIMRCSSDHSNIEVPLVPSAYWSPVPCDGGQVSRDPNSGAKSARICPSHVLGYVRLARSRSRASPALLAGDRRRPRARGGGRPPLPLGLHVGGRGLSGGVDVLHPLGLPDHLAAG